MTTVAEVQVSPNQVQVYVNKSQQFTATVTGVNSGVGWEVNGIPGGNSTLGTISSAGQYTAPPQLPSQGITIQAILLAARQYSRNSRATASRRACHHLHLTATGDCR